MLNENLSLFNRREKISKNFKFNTINQAEGKKREIRILIVTDDFLYSNNENFELRNFISMLDTTTLPSTKLIISKAHRITPGTKLPNDVNISHIFTSRSLENIDIIFMFATGQYSSLLSNSELKVLEKFMDDGGDVFSIDDHKWLELAMRRDLKAMNRFA